MRFRVIGAVAGVLLSVGLVLLAIVISWISLIWAYVPGLFVGFVAAVVGLAALYLNGWSLLRSRRSSARN
jgi:hypothetical protein